jgi:hypothetical protein
MGCSILAEFHRTAAGKLPEMCRNSAGIGTTGKRIRGASHEKKQKCKISLYLRERNVSPEKVRMWKNVFLEIKKSAHFFFILRWHALSAAKILMAETFLWGHVP